MKIQLKNVRYIKRRMAMKKFITSILLVLALCVPLFCLFGCSENIDGKYMLSNAGGQSEKGAEMHLNEMNDDGEYVNVNEGVFLPENFWVEIKGKTMTVHGSISPVVAGKTVKFNVNSENVRTIANFTLKTSESNKHWYSVYDERGEDTSYKVLKDGGSIVFEIGKPGDSFWFNITYNRA